MSILVYAAMALVVVALLIALVRIERGPSILDRAVATDVTTAAFVALIALLIAATDSAAYVPLLVIITLVGFLATVTIARFTSTESADEARILTAEEDAELAAREAEIDDDDAPVHGPDSPRVTGEIDALPDTLDDTPAVEER